MTITRLKQKLAHPVALVAQGFVAGTILFLATAPSEGNAQTPAQTAPQAASAR